MKLWLFFLPRFYKLSRRGAILAMVLFQRKSRGRARYSRFGGKRFALRRNGAMTPWMEKAADSALLRLFSQIVNSSEARYRD
jgi:hypothetical protein